MKRITPALICAGILPAAGLAHADTITQTYNIPTQIVAGPISGGSLSPYPAYSVLLPFEQFDSDLGTLDTIIWTYAFNFELTATIGDGGGGVSGDAGGDVYVDPARDAGAGTLTGFGNGGGNGTGNSGPITASFSISGGGPFSLSNENLAFFENPGGGSWRFEWLISDSSLDVTGNATDGTLTLVDGFSTVTYEFTPIPEPTSLALLGLGGLMFLHRR